jgi:threonine aldolase
VDRPIELRSDNAAGVAPEILAAVVAAGEGSALAYGGDEWTDRLQRRARDVFEHDRARVFPVVTGTAANALALSAMCPPWGAVLCHDTAHVLRSECGATSMFGGGAVLRGLRGHSSKLWPASLEAAFADTRWDDPHHSQPRVLSLTCPTDRGAVYSVAELAAVASTARGRGLSVHLDGARLANAVAALGCSPAELTWRAGVDVVSLGATKNGALSTDAIVSFDDHVSEELVYRTKRAGHVASKMRFQSVQLDAYLTDTLWLRLARTANDAMAIIAAALREAQSRGAGVELLGDPDANMAFVRLPAGTAHRLEQAGVHCYEMGDDVVRLVTSFQTSEPDARDAVQRIVTALG